MKASVIHVLFLLVLLQQAQGQVENICKLQQSLPAVHDSLRYVDALNTISLLLYEQNLDSTHYYAVTARAISRRLQYAKGIADATNNLGIVFDLKGNTPLALQYYNDAYNQYSAIGDSSNIVQTLMNIGLVYNTSGNNQKAVSNLKHALTIGTKISQDSIVALVIYNFLLTYPGEFTQASASRYMAKATEIATKHHDTRLLVAIEQLKADNLIKSGQRDEGIKLLRQTVASAIQMKLFYLSMDPLIDLGDQLMGTDTAGATATYKQACAIADKNNFHSYSKAITKRLYNFYSSTNNISLAYYYSRKLLNVYEAEETTNDTSGIDYIEYALKDQQLEAAQVKSLYSNRLLLLVAAISVLAIAIIIIQLRNRRRSQKTHAVLKQQFIQLGAATEALEKSNKDYARLIRIVAHDLRNPIGAINSISKLILDDNKLESGEKEWLKLIHKSSLSCLQLISELLETDFILKEEALHKENIDLSGLLQQTVKLLGFRAQEKQQEIVLDNNTNAVVYADYNKLARVLNNLIVNAIKFSNEATAIYVGSNRTAEGILISVRDTGIGIPPAIAAHLFDPFTNAKRSGTAGEQSFGLGLYISKQIIEAHHGRIWFESTPGKGATFYILLAERKE